MALGSKNTDGPYTLTGLSLTYRAPGVDFPQPNQVAEDVYTTAPYDVNQFEGATVGPPAHSTRPRRRSGWQRFVRPADHCCRV